MNMPNVTVITPNTYDRKEMAFRADCIISEQDYKGKIEHLCDFSNNCIGFKRNNLCRHASGEIILHFDSDDIYAPDWITRSVEALQSSGADIVGLSNAYFYDTQRRQMHELTPKGQLYLCGATLCYWRKTWERKPFPDTSHGEDTAFISNNGRLHCHGYKEGFIATVHGGNTECHKALPLLKKTNATPALLHWLP